MGNMKKIGFLRNGVLLAGIAVALGARSGERPVPIEATGETAGNVVALSFQRSGGASDILLLVDEGGPGRDLDGRVDRGFLLQQVSGTRPELVMDLAYSRVKWDSRTVGVWQSGSERLGLRVSREMPQGGTAIAGTGLSHSTAWDLRMPVAGELAPEVLEDLRADVEAILGACDDYDCRAGGPGASYCSHSCGGKTCDMHILDCLQGGVETVCCGCGTDGLPCCRCKGV